VVAAFAVLAASCGDDGAAPSPTVTSPALDVVPAAYLRNAAGLSIEGGIGTYCWPSGSVQVCLDAVGPVTNIDPAPLQPGESVAVTFDAGAPSELHIDWYEASSVPPAPRQKGRVWSSLSPGTSPASSGTRAPSEPGAYVVTMFGRWQGKGDISYGFYVVVR
jgi:hypothetical protein